MNKIARFVLVCSILAALAAPALAHHSAAAYDTQKEVTVTGTVSQYRFGNPHVYMTLQVKKADGSTGAVEVEAGAASVLNGLGFKKESVAAGDVVTIVGNPSRNNPDKAVLGKDLRKQDGTISPFSDGTIAKPGQQNDQHAHSDREGCCKPFRPGRKVAHLKAQYDCAT